MIVFSLVCIAACFGLAMWAWQGLPVLDTYPVHWDAQGVANGYGSKNEILFGLSILPLTSIFISLLFAFIPKIEPIRASIQPNARPYNFVWGLCMVLFVAVQFYIAYLYSILGTGATAPEIPVNFLVIGLSVFFIILGNIMGKLRRNFLFGVRTPWTLSSDLAWDKTHRLMGRMMVATGVAGLACAVFLPPPQIGIYAVIGLVLATTAYAFIYSYRVWKSDPDKRT
ncbi:MAG: hypothetical protein COA69_04015 [Robiginitomaculum sp.]|nr:MAG: hypothetical protein COA69_04015 [Robiginitomaculum sp.]